MTHDRPTSSEKGQGSKLWQLSTCSVIVFLKQFELFISQQAKNSMKGRAYMGEVLIQVH